MLLDFYYVRWELFVSALEVSLHTGVPFDADHFNSQVIAFELGWTQQTNNYPTQPSGDTIAIANQIHAKYFAT